MTAFTDISVREAAIRFGRTEQTIKRWVDKGKVGSFPDLVGKPRIIIEAPAPVGRWAEYLLGDTP